MNFKLMITILLFTAPQLASAESRWREYLRCDPSANVIDEMPAYASHGFFEPAYQFVARDQAMVDFLVNHKVEKKNDKGEVVLYLGSRNSVGFPSDTSIRALYFSVAYPGTGFRLDFTEQETGTIQVDLYELEMPYTHNARFVASTEISGCRWKRSSCHRFHGQASLCSPLRDCSYDYELQLCRGPFSY